MGCGYEARPVVKAIRRKHIQSSIICMHIYIYRMCFLLCFLRTLLSAFNAKRVQHLRGRGRGKMGKWGILRKLTPFKPKSGLEDIKWSQVKFQFGLAICCVNAGEWLRHVNHPVPPVQNVPKEWLTFWKYWQIPFCDREWRKVHSVVI